MAWDLGEDGEAGHPRRLRVDRLFFFFGKHVSSKACEVAGVRWQACDSVFKRRGEACQLAPIPLRHVSWQECDCVFKRRACVRRRQLARRRHLQLTCQEPFLTAYLTRSHVTAYLSTDQTHALPLKWQYGGAKTNHLPTLPI